MELSNEHVFSERSKAVPGKYIVFSIDNEKFGIHVLNIREIIGMTEITPVPGVPDFIKGVINLRGKILPVIDFRLKVGMPPRDYDDRTCIIIVEVDFEEENIPIGVIVDRVEEVVELKEDEIDPPPNFGLRLDTTFISGMAKHEKGVITLLNISLLLTEAEKTILAEQVEENESSG